MSTQTTISTATLVILAFLHFDGIFCFFFFVSSSFSILLYNRIEIRANVHFTIDFNFNPNARAAYNNTFFTNIYKRKKKSAVIVEDGYPNVRLKSIFFFFLIRLAFGCSVDHSCTRYVYEQRPPTLLFRLGK